MSVRAGARVYGVGYRPYDGPRNPSSRAVVTVALHTLQRVLGLRRDARHKLLPALAFAIALVPAVVIFGLAIVLEEQLEIESDLPTFGDYYTFVGTGIALFAAFVAPEALCTDRRTGMLGLYLAGPLDRPRYLLAKAGAVASVLLALTLVPPLVLLSAYLVEGVGPDAADVPGLLLRIAGAGGGIAIAFAAVSLGVASLTSRKGVAAIGFVLVLFVPGVIAEVTIESGDAPDALAVAGLAGVTLEYAQRLFGDSSPPRDALGRISTAVVVAGLAAWTAAGAVVTWLAYRRIEARQ
jgi:hypothetical protein